MHADLSNFHAEKRAYNKHTPYIRTYISELLHQIHPHRPHARPLPINIHRNRSQQDNQLNNSNPDKNSLRPVVLQPPGDEKAKDESVQDVLAKVQRHERLAGVLPVAIDAEGDRRGGAERAAKRHDAEEHSRHDPGVVHVGGPAEADQAEQRGDGDRDDHDEAELRLVQAAVAAGHSLDDDVADFSRDGGAEDAADERGHVDEPCRERAELIVALAVDDSHALGDDDEPADGAGVDGRGPEHGRVRVQDEGARRRLPPLVLVDAAVVDLELRPERLRRRLPQPVRVHLAHRRGGQVRERQPLAVRVRVQRPLHLPLRLRVAVEVPRHRRVLVRVRARRLDAGGVQSWGGWRAAAGAVDVGMR